MLTITHKHKNNMEEAVIYGIGANFAGIDVSMNFLQSGVAGVGWDQTDAPDLHLYIDSIKKGDIIYIKSCNFGSDIRVKGIGIVTDNTSVGTVSIGGPHRIHKGKRVEWLNTKKFTIPIPYGKNNTRSNSVYREFHPDVIKEILKRIP